MSQPIGEPSHPAADRLNVPPRARTFASAASLVALALLLSGCNWIGYGAHAIAGGDKARKVWVDAQYTGLENKTVAVLVSADEFTLGRHPGAPLQVSRVVSGAIAQHVTGAKPMDPKQVIDFQNNNVYWNTLPYADLLKRLNVQRIVHVDLVQYATHEPGNRHVWQGVLVANLGVVEAEAANPNNQAYANTVRVTFPPDQPVGVLDADDATIQLGMLKMFSEEVGNLFREHQRIEK